MKQTESKITDVERINITSAIDFLVPYVHSIVKISSEVELPLDDFKKEIINLYFSIISEDNGRIEASAKHNNFEFSLLYTGTRSFVLKIDGFHTFSGFAFMETNKGMNIHDDLNSNNEHISSILMKQFLKYYKSPYLVTEVYKKFILEGKSFI